MTRKSSNTILKIAEGLLASITDTILFTLYFGLEASLQGYGKSKKAADLAHSNLEKEDYWSIKRSLKMLIKNGLVNEKIGSDNKKIVEISRSGKQKILSKIPKYDSVRKWENLLYLVTYDIPIKKNYIRNKFRNFLKDIGCRSLQDSVWVTPYNPKKSIQDFVYENGIGDEMVIVSSIGKDGIIGDRNSKEIVNIFYHLDEVNREYVDYIKWVRSDLPDNLQIIRRYLLILKNDPQVPFEFLPEDWMGEEANEIFNRACRK